MAATLRDILGMIKAEYRRAHPPQAEKNVDGALAILRTYTFPGENPAAQTLSAMEPQETVLGEKR